MRFPASTAGSHGPKLQLQYPKISLFSLTNGSCFCTLLLKSPACTVYFASGRKSFELFTKIELLLIETTIWSFDMVVWLLWSSMMKVRAIHWQTVSCLASAMQLLFDFAWILNHFFYRYFRRAFWFNSCSRRRRRRMATFDVFSMLLLGLFEPCGQKLFVFSCLLFGLFSTAALNGFEPPLSLQASGCN